MNTSRLAKSAIGVLGLIASLALVGDVWAAGAPSAVTASATAISVNRATLRGSVNPNGVATSWYFEYGTTTAYGSKTTPQTIDGSSAKGVSATVSNLPGGTGVHFRLVASSSAGMSLGSDVAFSTTGAAPTVTTQAATSISTQGARLTGAVNPNGLPTSWYFVYGTSTAYGSRTASQSAGSGTHTVEVSASISNLAATTGYHFQLIAANAAGTRGGGDRILGTVGAPSVQTGTVQSPTPTSATLTGTLAPNGETTRWHFDYGTTTGYGSSTPTQTLGAGSPCDCDKRSRLEPAAELDAALPSRRLEQCRNECELRRLLRNARVGGARSSRLTRDSGALRPAPGDDLGRPGRRERDDPGTAVR